MFEKMCALCVVVIKLLKLLVVHMRFITSLFLPLFIFLFSCAADAQLTNVPFENIFLNPNGVITASYAFGPHQIIFCYENNLQEVGVVTWPYQGKMYSSTLELFLKTQSNIQGSFADAKGVLTVTNNTPNLLIVSCLYGF